MDTRPKGAQQYLACNEKFIAVLWSSGCHLCWHVEAIGEWRPLAEEGVPEAQHFYMIMVRVCSVMMSRQPAKGPLVQNGGIPSRNII